MRKIITSTILFLAGSCFLSAEDSATTPTYSAQKPSLNTTSTSSTVSTRAVAKKGIPVTAKFLTVDLSEIYSKYNKAIEAQEKFDQAEQNARKEMNDMIQEGIKLGESYKDLHAKANNPALTDEAKKKLMDEAAAVVRAVEEKQVQISQFQQETNLTLTQRKQSVMNLHLSDMKEVSAKIAKERGANLVLNTTGVAILYSDGSADITEETIEALNSTKK